MKTAKDPRHQIRREVVKYLFAESFSHQLELNDYAKKVLAKKNQINTIIQK